MSWSLVRARVYKTGGGAPGRILLTDWVKSPFAFLLLIEHKFWGIVLLCAQSAIGLFPGSFRVSKLTTLRGPQSGIPTQAAARLQRALLLAAYHIIWYQVSFDSTAQHSGFMMASMSFKNGHRNFAWKIKAFNADFKIRYRSVVLCLQHMHNRKLH